MRAILGIDAAWTNHHPSGVALIRQLQTGGWESVVVSPSHEAFLRQFPELMDAPSTKVPVAALVKAARQLAGVEVDLVVADIPLARKPIRGRRLADREISKLFGSRGCAAHSPTPIRPGHISDDLRDDFQRCGFPLATRRANPPGHALIETYPHPALLSLMKAPRRVKYKVAKSKKYWPKLSLSDRSAKIAGMLQEILAELSKAISGIKPPENTKQLSGLKPMEDQVDALVCAWVGIQVIEGNATAVGDDEAAIWLPADALPVSSP
jgi:predicted RNase H-like nuclease